MNASQFGTFITQPEIDKIESYLKS